MSRAIFGDAAAVSRPTRARGLKSPAYYRAMNFMRVAPHAGAWIEIRALRVSPVPARVAPHAGAWIEINNVRFAFTRAAVAPHAGAWIEIWPHEKTTSYFAVAPHAGAWIEINPVSLL